jgi:pyruvate/2-oxoglutarate dehydrogenase complex dihydrolipoamide acyltransferase (E2) component
MKEKGTSYQVVDFPPERRAMPAFLEFKAGRHNMYALLEVDVTVAMNFIEAHKAKMGEQFSFTGYLIFCLARAVEENKAVQAYRKGNKRLILFNDVDVGFMIEQKIGAKTVLSGHVIRSANHKTYLEIHQEIRAVQTSKLPTDTQKASWIWSAFLLPWPLSSLFSALFRRVIYLNPLLITSMAGTVGISSVGMFGKGHAGWGISMGSHVLDLLVGGIARKLAEVDGKIEPRRMLSLTIIFDHDVIDGAPAARFTRRLLELIESGYGLDEEQNLPVADSQPTEVRMA